MRRRATFLVLTGQRRGLKYGIVIGGRRAWLSEALFETLLALVAGRLSPRGPFVTVSAVHVCRIRQVLSKILGAEAARRLIAAGPRGKYALTCGRQDISVDASFGDCPLPGPRLNALRAAILRALDRYRVWEANPFADFRQPGAARAKSAGPQRPQTEPATLHSDDPEPGLPQPPSSQPPRSQPRAKRSPSKKRPKPNRKRINERELK